MKALMWVLIVIVGFFLLVLFGPRNSPQGGATQGEVAACTQRGVDYYREIGSYPYLSDGRSAADEAALRCRRTGGAAF
jgi:hypothetical protein